MGAWYVWHAGRQKALGVKGKANRKAAVEAWHRLMAGTRPGGPPPAATVPEAPPCLRDLLTEFLRDREGVVKANTHGAYRDCLKPVVDALGSVAASELKPETLVRWSARQGWSDSTRHNVLGAVATAFRWAHAGGVVPVNPLAGLKRPPKASRGANAVVPADSFAKLYGAATPALRALLTLLRETGARPSELSRLTAGDVDFPNAVATLRDHKTARTTGKPRLVFLSAAALTVLLERAEACPAGPLLRNARGGAWTKDGIGLAVRRACKKAGVKAVAYGFRHSFATDALARGVPDATVAALLGHSSTAMLHRNYAHLTAQAQTMREALSKVRGAPDGEPPPLRT